MQLLTNINTSAECHMQRQAIISKTQCTLRCSLIYSKCYIPQTNKGRKKNNKKTTECPTRYCNKNRRNILGYFKIKHGLAALFFSARIRMNILLHLLITETLLYGNRHSGPGFHTFQALPIEKLDFLEVYYYCSSIKS